MRSSDTTCPFSRTAPISARSAYFGVESMWLGDWPFSTDVLFCRLGSLSVSKQTVLAVKHQPDSLKEGQDAAFPFQGFISSVDCQGELPRLQDSCSGALYIEALLS